MEDTAVLIWRIYKMQTKTFIKCLIFLVILFIGFSISYAELYSGGPWRGRVIDADTKEPIEGAVVVAIWYREYDGHPAGTKSFLHDVRETLTDKGGQFEIPTYKESYENMSHCREKDTEGAGSMKLFITGPTIREPNFIIYKPPYGNFPDYDELRIFAIGPGTSTVEYLEEYEEIYKGHLVKAWKRKTKIFPEGVVYYGKRCQSKIESLEKNLSFKFGSFFIPMEKAKEKIERLEIPLDCQDKGEPIPASMRGYKDDIEIPWRKGGYMVIELPKLKTKEERLRAIPGRPTDAGKDKLPLLHKLINEEHRYLGLQKVGRK